MERGKGGEAPVDGLGTGAQAEHQATVQHPPPVVRVHEGAAAGSDNPARSGAQISDDRPLHGAKGLLPLLLKYSPDGFAAPARYFVVGVH
jgi:hypothetical protein